MTAPVAAAGWWWADPIAALVLVVYATREAHHAWAEATAIGLVIRAIRR